MADFTAPLPATRTTGDTPSGGVAADVNALAAALVEARGQIKTPAEMAASSALSAAYAQTTDARLSDQRTPADASVTNAKVAAGAAIAASKIAGLAAVATSGAKGDVGLGNVANLAPAALADLDDFALAYAPRVQVLDAVITAATTLTANRHHKIDVSAGGFTVTLPTPTRLGQRIRVEKVDASANVVAIAGTIRGSSTTGTLKGQFRTIEFFAESLTSWRPANSHHTDAALDLTYEKLVARGSATAGQVPVLQSDGTLAFATPAAGTPTATPMRGWPAVGEWMTQDATGVTDQNMTNGAMRVYPLWVPAGTYDAVAFHQTASGSAGALIKAVVYGDSSSSPGHPGTLLAETAAVDATTSGVKQVTGISVVAPSAGRLLWVGLVLQGAPATVPRTRVNANSAGGAITASQLTSDGLYNLYALGYVTTGVTGAAPTAGPTTPDRDLASRMAIRRSA